MLQHHPQSHKNSFHCMIKRKQRACPCFQRSKFSWRHALQSWVGTELGAAAPWLATAQAQSKRRTVLAASEAGPSAAPAGGACLGGQQLRACMLKHLQVLPASGRWRGGQWLACLVLLQGGDAGAEQARRLTPQAIHMPERLSLPSCLSPPPASGSLVSCACTQGSQQQLARDTGAFQVLAACGLSCRRPLLAAKPGDPPCGRCRMGPQKKGFGVALQKKPAGTVVIRRRAQASKAASTLLLCDRLLDPPFSPFAVCLYVPLIFPECCLSQPCSPPRDGANPSYFFPPLLPGLPHLSTHMVFGCC